MATEDDSDHEEHTTPGEDVVEVLTREHETLQGLFGRVSSPEEDRPAVLQELLQRLASHVAAEKQFVVPVLKADVPDSEGMRSDLEEMHDRVEHLLTLIERRKVNSPDVPEMVTELLDLTDAHISQAETDVIPALRRSLTGEQLAEIGGKMTSDERYSLTHSHPLLPDAGPVSGVMRRVAEVVDRVRDHSSDIGRTTS